MQRFSPGLIGAIGGLAAMNLLRRFQPYRPRAEGTPAFRRRLGYYVKPKRKKTKRVTFKDPVKKVKHDVKELKKQMSLDSGTHIKRVRSTARLLGTVAQVSNLFVTSIHNTTLESALSNLKYYDPSNPGTLITGAGATGTFSKKFHFKELYSSMEIANNYQTPFEVTVYVIAPRYDNSISALQAFTDGLADVGTPSSTSPLVYPSDSPVFNKLWKVVKSKKRILKSGQRFTISHDSGPVDYDPAYNDSHSSTYKPVDGAYGFFIRAVGLIGHDTANDQQTNVEFGIDYTVCKKYVIQYQAGADIKTVEVDDNADTEFANTGVIGEHGTVDNISYSLE